MPDEFESFIGKVGGYEEALKQEYEVLVSDSSIDTVRNLIEKKIAQALPSFVDDLILIARAGDSDSARLRAIQFAFNWYFKESSSADDPFSNLLNQLTKVDENPQLRPDPPVNPNEQ